MFGRILRARARAARTVQYGGSSLQHWRGCASLPSASAPESSHDAVSQAVASAEEPIALASSTTTLGYLPPDIALRGVDAVHHALDWPWWGAIVGCTVAVRLGLLPLALHGTRQQGIIQVLRADLAPLQARIQASGGTDQQAAAEMQALYAKHGVSPMQMFALPLLQLPIFMSFFLGLRRLAESFPDAHTGGAYWFLDLGARDETFWLPAASGLSALALVRLSIPGATAGMRAAEAQQAELMKKVMSGVTMVSLPVAATMPASVLVFWVSNNCFSLCYTAAIMFPPTRAALGLPPRPGPYVGDPYAPDADASLPPLPGAAPSANPPDAASVNRAQLSAAETLAELASRLADRGKLDEAISMQQRSLAMRDAMSGTSEQRDLQHRDAIWRLSEMECDAGRWADAIATTQRWQAVGGDAATAEARVEELSDSSKASQQPPTN